MSINNTDSVITGVALNEPITCAFMRFLNEQATISAEVTTVDTTFVADLRNSFLNGVVWQEEKLEIFLVVKEYFSTYVNTASMLENQMPFQDFYEKLLRSLLHSNFDSVAMGLSEEVVAKIRSLESYVDKCFTIFKHDSLYMQVNAQRTVIDSYTKSLNELNDKQQEITDAVNNANVSIEQQAQKVAETSITILGIFVGIVMVFFGGFTILDSAAVGIFTASAYRLLFTLVAFGAILFNVVVLLFYLIGKLTHKTISCECQMYTARVDACQSIPYKFNCASCVQCTKFVDVCRLRNTMPYIYWGNSVIAVLMLFIFCMYIFRGVGIEVHFNKAMRLTVQFYNNGIESGVTLFQVICSCVITLVAFIFACTFGKPKGAYIQEKQAQKEIKRRKKARVQRKRARVRRVRLRTWVEGVQCKLYEFKQKRSKHKKVSTNSTYTTQGNTAPTQKVDCVTMEDAIQKSEINSTQLCAKNVGVSNDDTGSM